MRKVNISILNSIGQFIPTALSLLLTLVIVRLFSVSFWGSIVSLMAIYQITSTIVAWGNKEYLQRALASHPSDFKFNFTRFFVERLLLLIIVIAFVFGFKIVEKVYFVHFCLMLLGRFLCQGFDIIILKEKKFIISIVLELCFVIVQFVILYVLYNKRDLNPADILPIFWIPNLLKGFILSILFKNYFSFYYIKGSPFFKSFGFSMLSLSGLLHSKIDILLFSKFLNHESLGKYQIIMALLWNIQAIAQYISSPFVTNFYRLSTQVKNKLAQLLIQMGIVIVVIGVTFAFFLLVYFLKITFDWKIFTASIVFSFMSYYYIPIILEINKKKKEHIMLVVNLFGTFLLATGIYLVHFFIGIDFTKAIYLVTLHQLLITSLLIMVNNKLSHEKRNP